MKDAKPASPAFRRMRSTTSKLFAALYLADKLVANASRSDVKIGAYQRKLALIDEIHLAMPGAFPGTSEKLRKSFADFVAAMESVKP